MMHMTLHFYTWQFCCVLLLQVPVKSVAESLMGMREVGNRVKIVLIAGFFFVVSVVNDTDQTQIVELIELSLRLDRF